MRSYPRHSRWHPDNRPPPYGQSFIRTTDDGTVHMSQRKNVGYGFTVGIIVGTHAGVSALVAAIYRSHPSGAYGTQICWPPSDEAQWAWRCKPYVGGWSQQEIYAPYEQLGPDLWVLWYSHSESCE